MVSPDIVRSAHGPQKIRACLISFATLLTTAVVHGQEASTQALPTIDVIGGYEGLERLPGSGHIVDKEELYKSHVFTTNEALRKIPGVHVRDEEGFGLRPNIGIRGLNPTRSTKTLLLEDGLPLAYAPYGDNSSYYHPPVDRYERIEVLKGANQLLFGPQTIAGAINYITPAPPAEPGGYVSFTGGTRDYINGHLNYGGWYKNVGGLFDFIHKQGDGARDNTEHQIDDVNLKGIYEFSPAAAIIARFNYYREDSDVGYTGITDAELRNFGFRYNPFDNDEFDTERYGASVTHEWDINDSLTATTSIYWANFERNWWRQSSRTTDTSVIGCGAAFRDARLNGLVVNPDICGVQGRLREYYTYGIEPRLDLRYGLFGLDNELKIGFRAHREEQARQQVNGTTATARTGTRSENNERDADVNAFFVQNRTDIGPFSITPAVRFENVNLERRNLLTGARGREEVQEVIPGLSVGYAPVTGLTLFAGAHEGFAPPRVEDLITNAGGSLNLDAEQSINIEAGFRSELRRGIEVDATYFRNDFDNLIAVGSIAGGDQPVAQGEALFEGLELFARIDSEPFFEMNGNLYAQAAWTYTWEAEQSSPFVSVTTGLPLQGNTTGNRQPYAPEHLLTGRIGYSHPTGIDTHLEVVFVDEQFADFLNLEDPTDHPDGPASINARSGQFGKIDSYTVLNLAATYTFKPYGLDVFVGVKNLLDEDYIADRTRGILPGAPRLIHAGVKYSF